jgi:ribosomal protein S6E (S10)
MALAGLDKNRKFLRLAHRLNAVSGGMGEIMARGVLETLWSAAYSRADDYVGNAEDLEMVCSWRGESGALVAALLAAGGEDGAGFIEQDETRGGLKIHDLWDHAPPYVKKKAEGKRKREAEGKTISDVRREAALARLTKRTTEDHPDQQKTATAEQLSSKSAPVADKPSPRVGLGRVGLGITPYPQGDRERVDRHELSQALGRTAKAIAPPPQLLDAFADIAEAKAKATPDLDATAYAVRCVEAYGAYRDGRQKSGINPPAWQASSVREKSIEIQRVADGTEQPPRPQRQRSRPGEAPPPDEAAAIRARADRAAAETDQRVADLESRRHLAPRTP